MAVGDPVTRIVTLNLTSPADNGPVSASITPQTSGGKIVAVIVQWASPECSLLGVSLSNTADTDAVTLWKVAGKANQTYQAKVCVAEVDSTV